MLTMAQIRAIKPGKKIKKCSDGEGLYLQVMPTGKMYWRLNYRYAGKQKTLALGVYPQVSLKEAREARRKAKKQLAAGIDPSIQKKLSKTAASNSFRAISQEWYDQQANVWAPSHARSVRMRLDKYLNPALGARPIARIKAPELLSVLRSIEASGINETAHRVKMLAGQVFRYAIATGRAERDVSADLKGALTPVKAKHMSTITEPKRVGALLRAIDGYQGGLIVSCALKLQTLTFVRPGELRHAEWSEVDMETRIWRIPAEKMKMRKEHIVPLSCQALDVLQTLHPATGQGKYLFPSLRSKERPMSENTVNAALRRMGYTKEEMTGHGFRAMASTLLYEQGWDSELIERQLAHKDRNRVKAAYDHSARLKGRTKMMQAWADYLDALRSQGRVVNLFQTTG